MKKSEINVEKITNYLEQGLSYGSIAYLCFASRYKVIEIAQAAGLDKMRR